MTRARVLKETQVSTNNFRCPQCLQHLREKEKQCGGQIIIFHCPSCGRKVTLHIDYCGNRVWR